MSKTRVGVLRGGRGVEYEVSLMSGASVLSNIPSWCDPVDVLITKDGTFHVKGLPILPASLPKYIDVAFNSLHGEFGEDGQIQRMLNSLNVPYTGSDHFGAALSMSKTKTKDILKANSVKTPFGFSLVYDFEPLEKYVDLIFRRLPPPWVIKPADKGSSVGVSVAFNKKDLEKSLELAFSVSDNLIIEQYLKGVEATCGVIDNFRQQNYYALPSVEIIKPKEIWGYDDKYSGLTKEICPSCFSHDIKLEIEDLAKKVHVLLNLRHYSRTDFIITDKGVYVLEVNSLPGLTPNSLLPKSLSAIGCSYQQFIDHLLKLALEK